MSLFGQISPIVILGTQGVILERLAKSAEINAHKRSWPADAENVVIWPYLADGGFRPKRYDFRKVGRIG